MPHVEVEFGGQRVREMSERVPFEYALVADDCELDRGGIDGRHGYRRACADSVLDILLPPLDDDFDESDLTPLQDHGLWQKYDNGITSPLDLIVWTSGPVANAVVHDPADYPDAGNAFAGAIYYLANGGGDDYTASVDIVIDPHPADSDWDWEMCLIVNLHTTSPTEVSGHFLRIRYEATTDAINLTLIRVKPDLSSQNLTPGGGSIALPSTATVNPDFRIGLHTVENAGDYTLSVLYNGSVLNDPTEGAFSVLDDGAFIATGGDYGIQVTDLGWTTFMGEDKIGGFIDAFGVTED